MRYPRNSPQVERIENRRKGLGITVVMIAERSTSGGTAELTERASGSTVSRMTCSGHCVLVVAGAQPHQKNLAALA